MPYKSAEYFMFAGEKSTDYGIVNVNIDSGMLDEHFISPIEIEVAEIPGKDVPYFKRKKRKPFTIPVYFAFENGFDFDKLRSVARWLSNHNYYKPLIFNNNLNLVYYCMVQSEPRLIHTGNWEGYIQVDFITNGPYIYSQQYVAQYDLNNNSVNGTIINFDNLGDVNIYPEVYVVKKGNGDISIINLSNGGVEFKFTGLVDAEELYVHNEKKIITTNLIDIYRANSFNWNFLELVYGTNRLLIKGTGKFIFRYQYKFLTG